MANISKHLTWGSVSALRINGKMMHLNYILFALSCFPFFNLNVCFPSHLDPYIQLSWYCS